MAEEFLARGWRVIGTVREGRPTGLHDLFKCSDGRLQVETLDITDTSQVDDLKRGLRAESLDVLFVNAGIANAGGMSETIGDISTDEFVRVMVTNTLATMRTVEHLKFAVAAGGTIGVMSSGQGSVAGNEKGGNDVYRASKAALNIIMRSFDVRVGERYALLLLAPGWVKTELGGPNAPFSIEEVAPLLVDTIVAQKGKDRWGRGKIHKLLTIVNFTPTPFRDPIPLRCHSQSASARVDLLSSGSCKRGILEANGATPRRSWLI